MAEQLVGVVDHWYGDIGVAGVEITGRGLNLGDEIHVLGHTTDFTTTIGSMQVEHDVVDSAAKGDKVGIKVPERARVGDDVFLVTA
jgi:putative protease